MDAPEPNVREWKDLTGSDFQKMDRARTVVMLTCSPLEVHGPHLPTMTDVMEAEQLGAAIRRLLTVRHPEIQFLHMPPYFVAADVLPHPGSVMFRSSTVTRVMTDLGRSLARQGFQHIWVGNFHGGPRHFVPIEVAADRVNRRYGAKMISVFSLLVARLTRGTSELSDVLGHLPGLTPDDIRGDHHAGAIETSMMLHFAGDRVDPTYRTLPQRTVDQKLAEAGKAPLSNAGIGPILRGLKHKLKFYETETYTGKPAIASPETGRAIVDVLAGHAAEALSEVYTGRLDPADCHSPLWKLRWAFTNPLISRVFERVVKYQTPVF